MSEPQFVSAEIGSVAATTLVVTFGQAVALAEEESSSGSNDQAMTAAEYGESLIPAGRIARPGR